MTWKKWLVSLAVVLTLAGLGTAAEVKDFALTAAGNNDTPPDGFPEGMQRKDFNDAAREVMAALRRYYDNPQYLNINRGFVVSRTGVAQITITGVDLTGYYNVGRRVRWRTGVGAFSTGGVASASFSAGNTVLGIVGSVAVGTDDLEVIAFAELRTGALTATGNAIGDIALHTAAGPLLPAAYTPIGNTIGNLAIHSATGPLKALAYRDAPARTYAQKTSVDQSFASASEVAIGDLTNIAVPGTPDGVKKYRLNGLVNMQSDPTTLDWFVKVHLGAAGTIADAEVYRVTQNNSGTDQMPFPIVSVEITPASGDKVSLGAIGAAGQTGIIRGSGTVASRFSHIEIVEIQ